MKIIFLGAGHGVPEKDRCCSSTLIATGGVYYMIDCGAPVSDLLIRKDIPFSAIRAVFITHRHADHTFGLCRMLDLCNWKFTDTDFDVYMTEQKGVEGMRAIIATAQDVFHEERMRLHTFSAGLVFEDENILVSAVPTNHMNGKYPSYAFVVDAKSGEDSGKRVILTGDLHHTDASDFPAVAKEEPSDAIVSELVHFGVAPAMDHWKVCPTRALFVTHYSNRFIADPACGKDLDNTLATLPFAARIVHDGEEYEI